MQPLFNNIHLAISLKKCYLYDKNGIPTYNKEAIKILLSYLIPLMNGIEEISIYLEWGCSHHLYFLRDHFPQALSQIKCLSIFGIDQCMNESNMQIFAEWLHTNRADGQPRMLIMHLYFNYYRHMDFFSILKERFRRSEHACSFFIRWPLPLFKDELYELNAQTCEQLKMRMCESEGFVLISRCPINVNQGWLEEKEKQLLKWNLSTKERVIRISESKIGPLDFVQEKKKNEDKNNGISKDE